MSKWYNFNKIKEPELSETKIDELLKDESQATIEYRGYGLIDPIFYSLSFDESTHYEFLNELKGVLALKNNTKLWNLIKRLDYRDDMIDAYLNESLSIIYGSYLKYCGLFDEVHFLASKSPQLREKFFNQEESNLEYVYCEEQFLLFKNKFGINEDTSEKEINELKEQILLQKIKFLLFHLGKFDSQFKDLTKNQIFHALNYAKEWIEIAEGESDHPDKTLHIKMQIVSSKPEDLSKQNRLTSTKEARDFLFGDIDNDGILNIDDPDPFEKSEESMFEIKLSDELLALEKITNEKIADLENFINELKAEGIINIKYRIKNVPSIMNKLRRNFAKQIFDLGGALIIAKDYSDLRKIEQKIKERFKDKITFSADYYFQKNPHDPFYKAVHYGLGNTELQIKTDRQLKNDSAYHTLYKMGATKEELECYGRLNELADRADKGDIEAQKEFDAIIITPSTFRICPK